MKFTVHSLELHRPITVSEQGSSPDGTEMILEYQSLVDAKTLEPHPDEHLVQEKTALCIEPGFYLFVQEVMPEDDSEARRMWRDAAEALWLESLWRDTLFKDNRIRVRILSEDGRRVFQLFRETV